MKDLDVNVAPEKISVLGNEVRNAFRIYSRPQFSKTKYVTYKCDVKCRFHFDSWKARGRMAILVSTILAGLSQGHSMMLNSSQER